MPTIIEKMVNKCKNCGHTNFIHGGIFGNGNCLDCEDIGKLCYKFEEIDKI